MQMDRPVEDPEVKKVTKQGKLTSFLFGLLGIATLGLVVKFFGLQWAIFMLIGQIYLRVRNMEIILLTPGLNEEKTEIHRAKGERE